MIKRLKYRYLSFVVFFQSPLFLSCHDCHLVYYFILFPAFLGCCGIISVQVLKYFSYCIKDIFFDTVLTLIKTLSNPSLVSFSYNFFWWGTKIPTHYSHGCSLVLDFSNITCKVSYKGQCFAFFGTIPKTVPACLG